MLAVWTKQTTKLPQTQTRVVWDVLGRAWWWALLQVISHIWQQAIEIYRDPVNQWGKSQNRISCNSKIRQSNKQ
jgi:hypothetical protein